MKGGQATALQALRDLIEVQYGLAYPERQLPVLATRLERLLPLLGVRSFAEAYSVLKQEPKMASPRVIAALTIGETYFLRNRAQFETLRERVLPDLSRRLGPSSHLVIWSAGCASGEEPYSLAMWIREYAPEFWPNRLRIVATDINPNFLAQASRGRYTERSLRQTEDYWRQRYFSADNGALVIDNSLRKVVSFERHNLISGVLPDGILAGQVALVFCRNVFIYFSQRASQSSLELFRRALMPEGVLMLGHAEPHLILKNWRAEYHPGTFFYQVPEEEALASAAIQPKAAARASLAKKPRVSQTLARALPKPAKTLWTKPVPKRADTKAAKRAACRKEDQISPVALLQIARQAADAGDLERACSLLSQLTMRDKACMEGHFLTAVVMDQLGDWQGVRQALKKVLFLDKRLVLGHYLLAVLNERQGKQGAALRRYRTVCRLLTSVGEEVEITFGDGLTAGRLRELAETRTAELTHEGAAFCTGVTDERSRRATQPAGHRDARATAR